MARSYKKTTNQDQYYCENCCEWINVTDNTPYTLTVYQGTGGNWELDGEDWWDDYITAEFWICADCEYNAADANTSPERRQGSEVWVCGDCGSEYAEQDDARECCL